MAFSQIKWPKRTANLSWVVCSIPPAVKLMTKLTNIWWSKLSHASVAVSGCSAAALANHSSRQGRSKQRCVAEPDTLLHHIIRSRCLALPVILQ